MIRLTILHVDPLDVSPSEVLRWVLDVFELVGHIGVPSYITLLDSKCPVLIICKEGIVIIKKAFRNESTGNRWPGGIKKFSTHTFDVVA